MKVLVFGSTGFIGAEVACALARAGHQVIGVTRSVSKAKDLEAEEITPTVCDPADASQWRQLIGEVDCVIDCTGGDISKIGPKILDVCIEEAGKSRPNGPPLSYIYCSGTWLHGDDREHIISDRSPITNPMNITSWRLKIEQKAIASISKNFTANIVRPSVVYGGSGSLTATWFESAKAGALTLFVDKGSRFAMIHKSDAGEAFRLVAEKALSVPGVIFDISNDYPEPLIHIAEQLKLASNAKEIKYKQPSNDFEKALAASANLRPELARDLLGWRPRRAPFGENVKVYYHAWLASQA